MHLTLLLRLSTGVKAIHRFYYWQHKILLVNPIFKHFLKYQLLKCDDYLLLAFNLTPLSCNNYLSPGDYPSIVILYVPLCFPSKYYQTTKRSLFTPLFYTWVISVKQTPQNDHSYPAFY
jgi:hypothetical protein